MNDSANYNVPFVGTKVASHLPLPPSSSSSSTSPSTSPPSSTSFLVSYLLLSPLATEVLSPPREYHDAANYSSTNNKKFRRLLLKIRARYIDLVRAFSGALSLAVASSDSPSTSNSHSHSHSNVDLLTSAVKALRKNFISNERNLSTLVSDACSKPPKTHTGPSTSPSPSVESGSGNILLSTASLSLLTSLLSPSLTHVSFARSLAQRLTTGKHVKGFKGWLKFGSSASASVSASKDKDKDKNKDKDQAQVENRGRRHDPRSASLRLVATFVECGDREVLRSLFSAGSPGGAGGRMMQTVGKVAWESLQIDSDSDGDGDTYKTTVPLVFLTSVNDLLSAQVQDNSNSNSNSNNNNNNNNLPSEMFSLTALEKLLKLQLSPSCGPKLSLLTTTITSNLLLSPTSPLLSKLHNSANLHRVGKFLSLLPFSQQELALQCLEMNPPIQPSFFASIANLGGEGVNEPNLDNDKNNNDNNNKDQSQVKTFAWLYTLIRRAPIHLPPTTTTTTTTTLILPPKVITKRFLTKCLLHSSEAVVMMGLKLLQAVLARLGEVKQNYQRVHINNNNNNTLDDLQDQLSQHIIPDIQTLLSLTKHTANDVKSSTLRTITLLSRVLPQILKVSLWT